MSMSGEDLLEVLAVLIEAKQKLQIARRRMGRFKDGDDAGAVALLSAVTDAFNHTERALTHIRVERE